MTFTYDVNIDKDRFTIVYLVCFINKNYSKIFGQNKFKEHFKTEQVSS